MERERVTVAQGVPTQYRLLFDHPTSPRPTCRRCGSPARAPLGATELVVEMKEKLGCPVTVRYSSTEAANGTGTRLDDPPEITAGTVGRPNGRIELQLVDADGRAVTAPGTVGTVWLRSSARMREYWRDPERTAGRSPPMDGSSPVTSAGSATTATFAWSGGTTRCTSGGATTCTRARSRTCSAPTRRSPRAPCSGARGQRRAGHR